MKQPTPHASERPVHERSPVVESAAHRTVIARDGVEIFYEVVGQGPRTVVLANGLGGRLYSWEPILEALHDRYRFISWDYRGLFESGDPERIRNLSVPDHAKDVRTILEAEGVEQAVFIGWSMGVQVSLEFAVRHPERVLGLVLVNGTFGQAMKTAFQPLFRLPYIDVVLHDLVDLLRAHPQVQEALRAVLAEPHLMKVSGKVLARATGRPRAEHFFHRYMNDVFSDDHFGNFLRLFQELDAHSAYHHLQHIEQPALVVYGMLDFLTPPYQSRQMLRKLPNARGVRVWRSSHFVLVEQPQILVPEVERLLEQAFASSSAAGPGGSGSASR